MTDKNTGGELVVRLLESLGVRHVFGVPGGQTLAITDAILDSSAIEFVTARHEGAAAVMADAYGRITGTPGVCLATTGPGATNLLTGVGGALRDSSPSLVITCNNHAENIDKDDAQNADHVALFRPLTKHSRLVSQPSGIVQALEEAYVRAMSGNPGPVHVDFARDAIEATLPQRPDVPGVHPLREWVDQRPQADAGRLAQVARLIAGAEHPVLWLGNGCTISGAGEAALELAELVQAPVVTTFNGMGSVPTTHPLVFGALSRMGTNLSTRVLAESDLVVAVGNSLNAVSTSRWALPLPRIVQIDIEPTTIGKYYGGQTFGLVSDAGTAIRGLLDALGGNDSLRSAAEGRLEWIQELSRARKIWWDGSGYSKTPATGAGLSPADIVRQLRAAAPDDTLLVPDAGNPGVWSYLWEIRRPGTYLKPVGFGNMGFAVPAGIAASLVDPQRPVLLLVGDGSLGMTLAELETLARVGGRVCVVVFNDGGYGNIRQEQVIKYGPRIIGVDFGPVDYATVGRGLGLRAERVTDLDVLVDRVRETLAGDTPVVLDVPIDPDLSAWTYPAFQRYEVEEG
jgi:acetolactate synthase I/II/III large subunit